MDDIIKIFINNPEKEFYVREIAKIMKVSPTTISKYLKKYKREGILISENKLNHLIFKANINSRKFRLVKLFYNLELIEDSKLLDYLEHEFNYPKAIILFGSFAKAENISTSDIDLLIVSSEKKKVDFSKFEKKLRYKIQLFVHSQKEIERFKKENKELINSWINGITLYGFFEVV